MKKQLTREEFKKLHRLARRGCWGAVYATTDSREWI